jgi:hypothetical protein
MRNPEPLQHSATQRFIPLALNQCGRRGPYFEAILREHASLVIKRPSGCRPLHDHFAVPRTVALAKVLSTWGTRLTWAAQREHAIRIIRAVETHKTTIAFISSSVSTIHVPAGPGPRLAGIWLGINQVNTGFGNRGYDTVHGEIGRGLAG